jgi:hypothetical protein
MSADIFDHAEDDDCWNCGDEGYTVNSCIEDCCCCLDPEEEHGITACPYCTAGKAFKS